MPLQDAVWRTNHAMHPAITPTQEPLFNDTTFRYQLLHDLFENFHATNQTIRDVDAVNVAATLGIKGPNFLSCDPKQFAKGDNVLSVVYMPSEKRGVPATAWAAWEDSLGPDQWRPAACNAYIGFKLNQWWS